MRYFLDVASCVAHMLLRVSCAVSLFSFVSGSCVCSDYLVGMYFLVPGASLVVGHLFSILRFYAYRTSFLWSHRRVKFSYYIYKVNVYSRRRSVMFAASGLFPCIVNRVVIKVSFMVCSLVIHLSGLKLFCLQFTFFPRGFQFYVYYYVLIS